MNTRIQWAILSVMGSLTQTLIDILGIWAGLNLFHIIDITPNLEIVMWMTFVVFTSIIVFLLFKPKLKKGLIKEESSTKYTMDSKVTLTFLGQTQEVKLRFNILGKNFKPSQKQLEKATVDHLIKVFEDITMTVVVFEDRKS